MTCPDDLARIRAENHLAAAFAARFDATPDRIAERAAAPAPFDSAESYGPPTPYPGPLHLYDRTPGRPACSFCHRIMDAADWPAHCRERHPGETPEPGIRR